MAAAIRQPIATPRPSAARTNSLERTNRRIDTRANPLAEQLSRWGLRFAVHVANEAIRAMLEHGTQNADVLVSAVTKRQQDNVIKIDRRSLEAELRRLLVRNGTAALIGASNSVTGGKQELPDEIIQEYLRSKEIKVQQIVRGSYEAVQNSLRNILLGAATEFPRPSTGEIARRIRTQWHGDLRSSSGQLLEMVPDPGVGVLPTSRAITPSGLLYAFSSERAALIARTEMVQAVNTGLVAGYHVMGAKWLEWLAYKDGRSGVRQHDEMHGERVLTGDQFELPDGTLMYYPGDPSAPIFHLANCRCTVRPIFVASQKR